MRNREHPPADRVDQSERDFFRSRLCIAARYGDRAEGVMWGEDTAAAR